MILKAQVEIEIDDEAVAAWLEAVAEGNIESEFEDVEFPVTISGMRCMFRVSYVEKVQ